MGRVSIVAAGLLAATTTALPTVATKRAGMVYDYTDITPSKELDWVPCFESFTCTYLTVPLDYENQKAGTTDVAFIKYTGRNSTGQEILFNPGGPSASGVDSLIGFVSTFVDTFGHQYDWVSFDPRGVNNTGPAVSCFLNTSERDAYDGGSSRSTPLSEQYQSTKAFGQFCTDNNLRSKSKAKYVGTSAVVQDMMYYTELVAKGRGEDPERAKIWYYGISYGTVVGHTLAAMYPDRIGRIIVDGNVYSYEHYQGLQTNTIDDTDRGYKFFFEYCYDAGKACPFYKNDKSPADLENRYRALLRGLTDSPAIMPGSTQIIKRYEFEHFAFGKMYAPTFQFADLALAAAAIENGSVAEFWPIYIGASAEAPDNKGVPANINYTSAASEEAMNLIMAADVGDRYAVKTFEDYKEIVETMMTTSYYGAWTIATQNSLISNGLVISPPKSQIFPGFKKNTKTATPLLFIGNTGDPITPMSSAHKMSAYFPGSVVLTQNSPGHGFHAVDSSCTKKYAREYLRSGKLPPADTVCETDVAGKDFFTPDAVKKRGMGMERRGMY